jgi:hypothetical protein
MRPHPDRILTKEEYYLFFLCTEQYLLLPSVKRLHRFLSLVIAAQRTFLVAFFLAATFLLAGFLLAAAFFLVAFLALRIEHPPHLSVHS